MFRNQRYLLSILLILALAVPTARAATFSACELKVLGQPKIATDGPMAPAMLASPRLFYSDGGDHPDAFPFFASNEWDWHNTEWDVTPTDVLVGFGTNSAWDLASRKQAKVMMIGDWVLGPLIAQEFILRPMIRVAKSPGELMAMILGVPLPPGSGDLVSFEQYLNENVRAMSLPSMHAGLVAILERMRSAGVSEGEYNSVRAHYEAMLNSGAGPAHEFGVLRGHGSHINGHLAQFFTARYLPGSLISEGASARLVNHPEFSFLSSQETFDRFKAMYEHTLYAHTNYKSEQFYRRLKAFGDERGHRKYTFSLTNILDVARLDKAKAMNDLAAFRRMIYRTFPADKYEVVIFLTTNYRPPHGFVRLERETTVPVDRWHFTPRRKPNSLATPTRPVHPQAS